MFADRALVRSRLPALAVLVALTPCLAFAADPAPPPKGVLRDPHLFERLANEQTVEAFRLEGEWTAECDTLVREGGGALDCFVRTGTLQVPFNQAFPKVLDMLGTCTWVRSRGWTSPATPTLGFQIGDSLDVDLLISVRAMKATLSSPGEGCISTDLPESLYADLAWSLWGVDPENPDVLPVIHADMRRRGFDPDSEEDLKLVDQQENGPSSGVSEEVLPDADVTYYQDPPTPVTRVDPVYPEMAREAQIEGKVVLHVLVGKDGRVKNVKVIRSVTYLDKATVDAVKNWVFKPALNRGQPVAAWVEVPVEFHLPPQILPFRSDPH